MAKTAKKKAGLKRDDTVYDYLDKLVAVRMSGFYKVVKQPKVKVVVPTRRAAK